LASIPGSHYPKNVNIWGSILHHGLPSEPERVCLMSYEFTLLLSREITEEESAVLLEGGCAGGVLTTDKLPTNPDVTVTRLDFDIEGPSLAEVLETALEAVKAMPDLMPASLTVPAQPSGAPDDDESAPALAIETSSNGDGEAPSESAEEPVAEPKAEKKATTKPRTKSRKRSPSTGSNGGNENSEPSSDSTELESV
jgi:hypothetical protein